METTDLDIRDGVSEGGVIGRVFRNKRIEFTPYVGYYSYEEYPHRDLVLSCHIKSSLALPLFDSSGRSLGVIELLTTLEPSTFSLRYFQHQQGSFIELCRMLQRDCLDYRKGLCSCQNGFGGDSRHSVAEIRDIMDVVGKSCDVVFGQTWTLCKFCNSLSTSERFGKHFGASDSCLQENNYFLEIVSMFTTQKEEGVVGKVASLPHYLVYCEDVSKFSITEYPLAHFAHFFNLSACFAVCIRSSHLTGGQLYVLEFLTRWSYLNDRDLSRSLVRIIETMRQSFRTFSFYGEERRRSLSAHVIRMNNVEVGRRYHLDFEGSIGETSSDESDAMMIGVEMSSHDSSSVAATMISRSTVESELRVPIEAYYGDGFIAFLLSDTSIDALREQVSQGLNLENGTYIIKYRDVENDWIRIECDQDVNEYVKHSTSLGVYMLSIELKNSSQYQCFSIF